MLTQALARMPIYEVLRACSGYYLPGYEHSWLVSKHGYSIISGIYLENSEVLSDVITRNVNFWSDVAEVQASLEQVSTNL